MWRAPAQPLASAAHAGRAVQRRQAARRAERRPGARHAARIHGGAQGGRVRCAAACTVTPSTAVPPVCRRCTPVQHRGGWLRRMPPPCAGTSKAWRRVARRGACWRARGNSTSSGAPQAAPVTLSCLVRARLRPRSAAGAAGRLRRRAAAAAAAASGSSGSATRRRQARRRRPCGASMPRPSARPAAATRRRRPAPVTRRPWLALTASGRWRGAAPAWRTTFGRSRSRGRAPRP